VRAGALTFLDDLELSTREISGEFAPPGLPPQHEVNGLSDGLPLHPNVTAVDLEHALHQLAGVISFGTTPRTSRRRDSTSSRSATAPVSKTTRVREPMPRHAAWLPTLRTHTPPHCLPAGAPAR